MFKAEIYRTMADLIAEAMKDPVVLEEADCLYLQTFRCATATVGADVIASGDQSYIDWALDQLVFVDAELSREEGMQILKTLEFYELCNYKGEGEGVVIKTPETESLPIFHSKYDYEGF